MVPVPEVNPVVERNQVSITLGDAAMKEYREVAKYLGIPVATLLRQILEDHHRSMDFSSMLRRARARRQFEDVDDD